MIRLISELTFLSNQVGRATQELELSVGDAQQSPGVSPFLCQETAVRYLKGHGRRIEELIRLRDCWAADR